MQLQLVFGTYNQQPHGTPPETLERTYQNAYRPFLSLINEFPDLPVLLHYSGTLCEWLEAEHSEFFMLIREMVARKQVELLGGAFYEPILSLIPDADKMGQIEKLTTYIRTTFGVRPRGAWITERVWEPGLTRILSNCGLSYTFLDDRYFQIAGLEAGRLHYPYLTEEQGKTVTVYPLSAELIAASGTLSVAEVFTGLRELADSAGDGRRVIAVMLAGESVGEVECTWLREFLTLAREAREWLLTATPRRQGVRPQGKLYFPCLAAPEMMKSALSRERRRAFEELCGRVNRRSAELYLHGGYFRHFLSKYPEVNLLYSRLVHTHLLVNQIRGDRARKKAARNEVWRGQSGAVYWHAGHGGAYSSRLRKAAYRAFLEAERIARQTRGFVPSILETDFDMDGDSEYLYLGVTMNAFVHARGARMLELDYLPAQWNYLDTMSRWAEPYHRSRREGNDRYMRRGFIDHFLHPRTDMAAFDAMTFRELGNFVDRPFEMVELKREGKGLTLQRDGSVRVGSRDHPVRLAKRYHFGDSSLSVRLTLTNLSGRRLALWYASELNLALASPEEAGFLGSWTGEKVPMEAGEHEEVEALYVQDLHNQVEIALSASQPFLLWNLPLETVGYEGKVARRSYQGSCLVSSWRVALEPAGQWETELALSFGPLQRKGARSKGE